MVPELEEEDGKPGLPASQVLVLRVAHTFLMPFRYTLDSLWPQSEFGRMLSCVKRQHRH